MPEFHQLQKNKGIRLFGGLLLLILLITGFFWSSQNVFAQRPTRVKNQGSPLHPTFPLLDENGQHVLTSGAAVSTMQTCGSCHDTAFIETHSFHASVGLDELSLPGETTSERAWDISPGFFGKWNAIVYRYLSPQGDQRIDLSTSEWIQNLGARHVGGGPAVYSRDGTLLTELVPTPGDPETHVVDPETGESIPWDWGASGVVEMNCFLCHTPNPNNQARIQTLHEGNFHWANTATLVGTGIVEQTDGILHWNQAAFTEGGELRAEFVNIQDPANDNCGLCHGLVHDNVEDPLVMYGCSPERWSTITTGQIISPQRLSDTGMNLANKEELYRPWDVHAERLLKCTDCHYSLNNPLYYKEAESTRPEHLTFDPRRLEIGEYLEKPLHQFARGDSAQSSVAPDLKDTMRHCDSCHSVDTTHEWLPYKTRHMEAISCESCHIPKLFSSANRVQDWTVIHLDGSPRTECRGVEGNHETLSALLIGYEPVLLSRKNVAGKAKLAPYNLITSWFWVYGNPPRPVRLADLKSAYLENGDYHPGVLTRFDRDEDGQLGGMELVLDSSEKEAFIKDRLSRLGLENPRITAEIQPYSINHDIATGEWAIQDCQVCHSEESRVDQPFQLASTTPGGVMPEFVGTHIAAISGEIIDNGNGELYYQPMTDVQKLYVLGHDNVGWVDLGGSLIFVGVLLGVLTHAGLRFYIALRGSEHKSQTESVYMYALYERLWHWLQTFVIVLLLFTGLIIHKPDTFGIFSFRGVVLTHNVLAAILVINAALALFYHLASGEIQQFIPRPRGFFDQAISQALFYLRGIFRGEEHPFEKTPRKKLNPLQQITYFTILNVLLPLQIITGAMMWGAQHWGELANRLGGLPFLAPFHTLIAWLFAAFIVMHVYLTTTGPTPTAGIRAMMMGWDEIETHTSIEEVSQV